MKLRWKKTKAKFIDMFHNEEWYKCHYIIYQEEHYNHSRSRRHVTGVKEIITVVQKVGFYVHEKKFPAVYVWPVGLLGCRVLFQIICGSEPKHYHIIIIIQQEEVKVTWFSVP